GEGMLAASLNRRLRMKGRAHESLLPAALTAAVMLSPAVGLAQSRQVPAETMAASKRVKGWTAPRTPWGHPDLQGVWTTDEEIGVPIERPAVYGEKAILTDQEFAGRQERPGDPGAGPEHWYEGGKHVSRRTSLVFDPPNGRIPEYTPEAQTRVVP